MNDVLNDASNKMNSSLKHLQEELRGLRTGRANPSMVEKVMIEAYGTSMRLTDIATISVPEARILLISPFDANNVHAIAKSIEAANLNLQPVVDGNVVRITVQEIDSKVRQNMVKQAREMGETTKIAIRKVRKEANDFVKKEKSDGNIPEDVMKSLEKKVQELTDKSCKEVDTLCATKEKEITTI